MSGRGVCGLCGWDDDSHSENGAVKRLCEVMADNVRLREALQPFACVHTCSGGDCAWCYAARALKATP
jgi:hypothetical protein